MDRNTDNLARFRADPSKVRISVRPCRGAFFIRIQSRTEGIEVSTHRSCPITGVMVVLKTASKSMDGIDLGMQCAYPHPMMAT